MEPTDSNDNVPLSRDECGDETHTEREQAEGLASLQWQREEGGRMSRRETRRRTPTSTPHRLAALQEATARAGEDSDDDERRDVEGHYDAYEEQQQKQKNSPLSRQKMRTNKWGLLREREFRRAVWQARIRPRPPHVVSFCPRSASDNHSNLQQITCPSLHCNSRQGGQ